MRGGISPAAESVVGLGRLVSKRGEHRRSEKLLSFSDRTLMSSVGAALNLARGDVIAGAWQGGVPLLCAAAQPPGCQIPPSQESLCFKYPFKAVPTRAARPRRTCSRPRGSVHVVPRTPTTGRTVLRVASRDPKGVSMPYWLWIILIVVLILALARAI